MANEKKNSKKSLLIGVIGLIALIVIIFLVVDPDVRKRFGSLDTPDDSARLRDVQAKAPTFGTSPAEVEKYCGKPDASQTIERPEATMVIVRYATSELKECLGTFSFVDDKLNSIEPLPE